ncbi:MAG: hypothetical protein R2769_12755 [Saprospiraceae bacterium]
MFCKKISLFFIMSILLTSPGFSYPIDGYMLTGIKRLFRLQLIVEGKLKDQMPVPGALKKTEEIKLTLYQNELGKQIEGIPEIDPDFQKNQFPFPQTG